MDIIFFGSGSFAIPSLKSISEAGHTISLVITQPDRPRGRHLCLKATELKAKALELKLNVYQPQNPNDSQTQNLIQSKRPDLFIVASYGRILKNTLLRLPRICPLNIHASLLPKYRGAAPINWAILNDEKYTGVTIIRMNEMMDAGDILTYDTLPILIEDNALTLEDKLSVMASELIIRAMDFIKRPGVSFLKQNNANVTYAPKLTKADGLINWFDKAPVIINKIRGLLPWPAAYTYYKGKLLKIWKAEALDKDVNRPGEILEIAKGGLVIGAANGLIRILELQFAGEKRLTAEAFICGHRLSLRERLGLNSP